MMGSIYSGAHEMGKPLGNAIRCDYCTHKRAILYGSGVLYCWNCKHLKGA